MALVRLQKWLSEAGVCSRRHGENLIRAGKVRVNGEVVTTLGTKVDPEKDHVQVDGRPVKPASQKIYVALHKPKGYVTSCDHPGQKLVIDLIDLKERIYPVGRLDKDSTGLLLLTNDGHLHHQLSHPSFDHEKEYDVTVDRPIDDGSLRRLAEGVRIVGGMTRPAGVRRMAGRRFRIVLLEGRNRQIRRMVKALGYKVKRLKRIRMAHIHLGDLPEGAWRHLTRSEMKRLYAQVTGKNKS